MSSRPRSAIELARTRLIQLRNAVWENVPVYGGIELRWRTRRALNRHWDLALVAMLPRSPGAAVDVGANIGMYARLLARSHREVHAFEANPRLIRRLRRAAPKNVVVHPVGLSDHRGPARLRVPISGGSPRYGLGSLDLTHDGSEADEIDVALDTLDGRPLSKVDFVKIDVEGHELPVLVGAKKLLAASRPRVMVECEERHRPGTVQAVNELLAEFGYVGYFPWEMGVLSVRDFDVSIHQPADLAGRASRGYAHMFLFAPESDRDAEALVRAAWQRVYP
jgi:FkbM family methyltransferase